MTHDASKIIAGKIPDRCPHCGGTKLIRRGTRKKKYEVAQLWFCYGCSSVFSTNLVRGKHYPLRVIIDALCWYHQGFTVKETLANIKRRYGRDRAKVERVISRFLTN